MTQAANNVTYSSLSNIFNISTTGNSAVINSVIWVSLIIGLVSAIIIIIQGARNKAWHLICLGGISLCWIDNFFGFLSSQFEILGELSVYGMILFLIGYLLGIWQPSHRRSYNLILANLFIVIFINLILTVDYPQSLMTVREILTAELFIAAAIYEIYCWLSLSARERVHSDISLIRTLIFCLSSILLGLYGIMWALAVSNPSDDAAYFYTGIIVIPAYILSHIIPHLLGSKMGFEESKSS